MSALKQNILYLLQFLTLIGLSGYYSWGILEAFGVASPLLWVGIPLGFFIILFIIDFETSMPISYGVLKPMKKTAEYFLAGCIFFLFSHVTLLFVNLFFGFHLQVVSVISLVIFLYLFFYSYYRGQKIFIKPISFTSKKVTRKYSFVQLSDVHIGSNGNREIKRILSLLETLSFEFVIITGDLIDEDYARHEDIRLLAEIEQPVYYITGNHEYNLNTMHFSDFIEKTDIVDMNNKKLSIDELDLYGIDETGTVADVLGELKVNTDRCSVALLHTPYIRKFNQADEKGIDFIFSGHTHNGQFFPLTILAKFMYRYIYGIYIIGNMTAYVSQGTGTWGPQMRLGTSNEITHIAIIPE